MKNLFVKCIETFLIYIFIKLKSLIDMIVINFIFESSFHIYF